jgi:hypothetical protein
MAVHRIIEANAAQYGDASAITGVGITLSYRELNQRANSMARHLLAQGFRRGGIATVCLPYDADTVVVLLAILKAGGTYVMMNPATAAKEWPRGVSFAEVEGEEIRYRLVGITPALPRSPHSSANLPIVVRGTDLACVIADTNGEPLVLVPHATILSLRDGPVRRVVWRRRGARAVGRPDERRDRYAYRRGVPLGGVSSPLNFNSSRVLCGRRMGSWPPSVE